MCNLYLYILSTQAFRSKGFVDRKTEIRSSVSVSRSSSLCFCVSGAAEDHQALQGRGEVVLLGVVVEDRLEITNCFPFPQHTEDDADFDVGKGIKLCSLLGLCN